ncbi:hypothetical protein AQ490_23370 [Wenjunlia vitaminophila]|uniref:Integrase n=2 Tax=Wenjunlia vitaminophila TaxID=76728 RepID=A0A0T6LRR6_WENVI|nr:site-specific integrase [Wenjunlia vitaminophila]KRV48811.1 hypothetical protein AQ490_23370 [Wenjunlia vitaminophila]
MAYIVTREYRDGSVRFQVKWRLGGSREGRQQSEQFETATDADAFRAAVDDAGQQWPAGWVKGRGFIANVSPEYRFSSFARASIEERTGIDARTRKDYLRDLERWIAPTFGECDIRSADHFSKSTIARWLIWLEQQTITRGKTTRKISPKTIRNLHGLLSSILQEAVEHEPPLRQRNPCALSTLPRSDDETEDDKEFLTPQEVSLLISCFAGKRRLDSRSTGREDQLLCTIAYGTGLRWGELTALRPQDVIRDPGRPPRLRVQRAWKRADDGTYFLGRPKTRMSRRTITISETVLDALVELGLDRLGREDLLIRAGDGGRLHYSTFGDRWARAVKLAQAQRLNKRPTPHDLRHSHAAALISAGQPLTYIQRRLGHESIQTTSDVYGHLLPEVDDEAMAAVESALKGGRPPLRVVG